MSVADIEALELAGLCRYERGVLPAAVFNFSQVEQLRNFENLYRRTLASGRRFFAT
jgi:hypothetical protein